MNTTTILILTILLAQALSISITVDSQSDKCMIIYSRSEDDFFKIDLKMPRFKSQTQSEYYRVLLINTETNFEEQFKVTEGVLRKQLQLQQSVLYKLCIKIMLNRYGTSQVQEYVEYNSGIKHRTPGKQAHQSVPQTLLKVRDIRESYLELVQFIEVTKEIQDRKTTIKQAQAELFTQQQQKIGNIQMISFIEFAFVAAFGVYQYYRLKAVINHRQS